MNIYSANVIRFDTQAHDEKENRMSNKRVHNTGKDRDRINHWIDGMLEEYRESRAILIEKKASIEIQCNSSSLHDKRIINSMIADIDFAMKKLKKYKYKIGRKG